MRLVYADFLDENGDHDRAEFVRVQCELTKCRPDCGVGKVCRGVPESFAPMMTCAGVRSRESALLAAHGREWRGAKRCVTCEGATRVDNPDYGESVRCEPCRGTGWACWPLVEERSINDSSSPEQYLIRSTFRRGFLHRIELTAEQFLAPGVAGLIGLWHPTIQEVGLVGVDPVGPIDGGRYEGAWFWLRRDIPDQLEPYLSCIPESNPDAECGYYDTRDEANAALSRACVQHMRDEAAKLVPA